jgi:dephospho-CoA kinase
MIPSGLARGILCVGLTGGIGCGKSTVAKMFQERGAFIIDTDEIAHQLTQSQGLGIAAIRSAFGDRYIMADGALDRARMRELIFSDRVAKQKLESLLHPLIFEQAQGRLQQATQAPYVVMVVPLLLESPAFMQRVQRILVVDCAEHRQIERVLQRSKLSEAEVRAIMAQQTGRARRLNSASDVIHNDGDLIDLARHQPIQYIFRR